VQIRITKYRVAMATLFVLAGAGLGNLLSPFVGSALATVGQTVNISDHSSAAYFATVDKTGALKTTAVVSGGYVGQNAPQHPFFTTVDLYASAQNNIILANKSVVALTRISVENHFAQAAGETARITLVELGGNATVCDGSSGQRTLGNYEVDPGESFSDAMQSPIVLQPLAANDVWCLAGFASLEGSPNSYILPTVSISGFAVSGGIPPMVQSAPQPGDAPQRAR
jgi:hypothetical protein